MRILFVIPEFPPQYGGGIATYYKALVPAIVEQGHEVSVLVGSAFTDDYGPREEDGLPVEYLDTERRKLAFDAFSGYDALPLLRRTMAAAWALFEQAKGGAGYDVVETTDFGLLFLPWVVSNEAPPVLVQLHASNGQIDAREPKAGKALQGHLMRMLELQGLACADALQSCGQANVEEWQDRLGREVLYCPPPLYPADPMESKDLKIDSKATGFVAGRIQYWKGPTVLCEAQARLGSDAPLIDWAGRDTSYREVGASMSEYLANSYPNVWERTVRPIGQICPGEVAKRQAASDFVVIPSIWDVFNYTAAEALGLGSVVICSSGAGASGLIEDGVNGFVFPAQSAEALARILKQVSALTPTEKTRIGQRARLMIQQELHPVRVASQRLCTYNSLIQRDDQIDRDLTWLEEAVKPRGAFDPHSGKPMAFLDQHSVSNVGRYIGRRLRDKILGSL